MLFKIYTTIFCLLLTLSLSAQWTTTYLSEAKAQLGSASLGNKVYFAGGSAPTGPSNLVEIYDIQNETWQIDTLTAARAYPGVVAAGSKVFVAGGIDWLGPTNYATVDIFDTLTQEWTQAELSSPRMYVQPVAVQNKVLFAGGYHFTSLQPLMTEFTNTVDVYDLENESWSVDTLSIGRGDMGVAVLGDKAYFGGGRISVDSVSNRIDIYDASTDTWSTDSLVVPRAFLAATTAGSKVLFAGGTTQDNLQSDLVEIYDTNSEEWSYGTLLVARSFSTRGGSACEKAFFIGSGPIDLTTFIFTADSDVIDIYDAVNDEWSLEMLPRTSINHTTASISNHILVAGGLRISGGFSLSNEVNIFTCETTTDLEPGPETEQAFNVYPNPFGSTLYIEQKTGVPTNALFRIYNDKGQLLQSGQITDPLGQLNLKNLNPGIFFLELANEAQYQIEKLVKAR